MCEAVLVCWFVGTILDRVCSCLSWYSGCMERIMSTVFFTITALLMTKMYGGGVKIIPVSDSYVDSRYVFGEEIESIGKLIRICYAIKRLCSGDSHLVMHSC